MTNRLLFHGLLFFLTILSTGKSIAQNDTVYFDKLWLKCNQSEAKYYRIVEESDSLLKITDHYIKGGKQSEGYVENTSGNKKILRIRGDFEFKPIGEYLYYRKNGKLYSRVNSRPFHEEIGVKMEYLELLDSLDTSNIDLSRLRFHINYYKNTIEYGFLLDDSEKPHGTWLEVSLKSKKVLNRSHHSEGKFEGTSEIYYRNGSINRKYNYKNDVSNGEQLKYNRKGRLIESKTYENGILKETWRYRKPKKK